MKKTEVMLPWLATGKKHTHLPLEGGGIPVSSLLCFVGVLSQGEQKDSELEWGGVANGVLLAALV